MKRGLLLAAMLVTSVLAPSTPTGATEPTVVPYTVGYWAGRHWPVEEAVAAWNVNGVVRLEPVVSCVGIERCVRVRVGTLRASWLGVTYVEGATGPRRVYLNRLHRHDRPRLRLTTAVHELGHALGLAHRDGWTVMREYADPRISRPTAGDLRLVRSIWSG